MISIERCSFISIHALLAESDIAMAVLLMYNSYFYPRSPCGERLVKMRIQIFNTNFYPRSPCGERHTDLRRHCSNDNFYPRSPCGERPLLTLCPFPLCRFLSTLSLRRATLTQTDLANRAKLISIHALLAESDALASKQNPTEQNFYPRSPCGERQARKYSGLSFARFLSTLSLRRATNGICLIKHIGGFLSTLSLRRATLTDRRH